MTSENRLAQGIVLTLSAEPLELRPAALKFLLRLRQLAGHTRRYVTYTKSLATMFQRCTNSIRTWRNYLVDAGYIHWMTNPRNGKTTILITEKVEPPSRRAKLAEQRRIDALPAPLPWQPPKPVVMPPDKAPWWKYPTKSVFCLGGTQFSATIKTNKNLPIEPTQPTGECFEPNPNHYVQDQRRR
jgi:hypothetical protein